MRADKQRAWWSWPLWVLGAISVALVGLVGLLVSRFSEPPRPPSPPVLPPVASSLTLEASAPEASEIDLGGSDAATVATALQGHPEMDAAVAATGESDTGGIDAGETALGTGTKDASTAKETGAVKDAGRDATSALEEDDRTDGAGGPKPVVTLGPAAPASGSTKAGPHRRHDHTDAVKWRVAAGYEKVARTEQRGPRYDVWLGPGRSFEGVRVEWQDKAGKWHVH